MKLEKFKQRNFKKIGISIFTVGCILLIAGVFFYTSFASFETHDEFNIIKGNVQDLGDVYFAYYIDDEVTLNAPLKNSGYVFDQANSSCTNGASVRWNYEEWGPLVTNLSTTRTKCYLRFKTGYSETLLNGADPVVEEPLIPVTIENDGTVKKADVSSKWYSYEEKTWANAIILKNESTANTYNVGDTIPESAIESYFVWIPRYRYQIFDDGNYTVLESIENAEQTIQVIFENKDTPVSDGATVGGWLTHPAFTAFNSNGMWVGKFETGTTLTGEYNVRNKDAIQIKPNVVSWRDIQVSNAFYTSYDYKRSLESHMMKNTEWGAVAYLQHSAYGSQASVRINNNSDYITGYQGNVEPTCGYTASNEECNRYCNDGSCNTAYPNSVLASTTGNISGIYDMSGGAWEYVMGVLLDENGKPMSGRNSLYNSGFNGIFGCPTCDSDTSELSSLTTGYDFPESKYYDTYAYATVDEQFQRRILGDATGEIGPFASATYLIMTRQIGSWYADAAWFVLSSSSWFVRGSEYNSGLYAGIFAFGHEYGRVRINATFRVILTPGGSV